jgi:hypothetical protein
MDELFEVVFDIFVVAFEKEVDRLSWKVSNNANEFLRLV